MPQIRTVLGGLIVCALMAPSAAFAYVGPGAGLSMLGSLIAVVGAVIIAVLGLVLFPLRLMLKRRRKAVAGGAPADGDAAAKDPDRS